MDLSMTALNAALTAQSAANAASAKSSLCQVVLRQYDAASASVAAMQEYAACVAHLYPQGGALWPKLMVAAILAATLSGAVFGVWHACRGDRLFGGFFGAAAGLAGSAILSLFAALVWFIFS